MFCCQKGFPETPETPPLSIRPCLVIFKYSFYLYTNVYNYVFLITLVMMTFVLTFMLLSVTVFHSSTVSAQTFCELNIHTACKILLSPYTVLIL